MALLLASMNPYVQGGWIPDRRSHFASPPSVFGALPCGQSADLHTFIFTSPHSSIVNSTVSGPTGRAHFYITTDVSMEGYTVIKNDRGRSIALLEWQRHPAIEIRNIISKRPVSRWMCLSSDQGGRYFDFNGHRYTWIPSQGYISLYSSNSEVLVRISRGPDCVILELTSRAIALELLEISVVSTVLLQCGRNID